MSSPIPEHELPNWMKQAQRGVDWGALLVLAFALLAGWTFLFNSQISATTANEHFAFQASDIAQAMREGIFYPRWSPYAVQGYGAPIPHYYPQAAAYLVALFDVLFTNDLVFALRLVYLTGFLFAGASIYSLVTQRSNALVGVVAALAYLFNPYLSYSVPHLLGDLPLFLGLAWIPVLLWVANRLLLREQPIDIALLALVTALFVLTIPRLLPQALLLLALLIGFDFAQSRNTSRLVWILGGLILGLGLATCYWMPAILERNLVNWYPALISAEPQIVRFPDVFSQPAFLDAGFLSYENYFSLGWGLILVAGFGAVALILKQEYRSFHSIFLFYGLILLLLLWLLPQETELLASISLCFAIGGAYIANYLRQIWRGTMLILLLLCLNLFALAFWQVPSSPLPIINTDASAQLDYEKMGYGIAVLPAGLAIPSNVPPRSASNFESNTSLDAQRLSASGISLIRAEAYHGLYQVFSMNSIQANYQRAYFVGWEAWLGNQSLPIVATENGLMRFEIPASNASLTIGLGSSWLRSLAWLMSISAVLSSSAIWWLRWRRIGSDYDDSPLLSLSETRLLLGVLVVILGLHLSQNLWLSLPPRYSLQNASYLRREVDSNLQLLAYEIREQRLYLFWEASRPSLDQYQIRLRLLDSDNRIISESNYSHPSYLPTNRWLRGFVVPHSYDLPAGSYSILVDVYRCDGVCGDIGNPSPTVELRLE